MNQAGQCMVKQLETVGKRNYKSQNLNLQELFRNTSLKILLEWQNNKKEVEN